MPVYITKLVKKEEVAKDTMAFYFEKPAGLAFRAGNSLDWTLINPPDTDQEGDTRAYSIASAPFEDFLMFATRMRDTAFKRVINNMPMGSQIKIEGPFGSFFLHNNTQNPAVCLAGGIGITPFRSIILQATHDKLTHKIFLFYANKTRGDAAFLDELEQAEHENPNFKLVTIMTQAPDWTGESGHIDKYILEKYVGDLSKPIFYTAGPLQMVTTLRNVLTKVGISEDNIKFEEFPGY